MNRIPLGAAALEKGGVRIIWYKAGKPPKKSFLVVHAIAGLRVYWNVCQHLPIPLDGGSGKLPGGEELVCVTHGARYRSSDGHCVDGPCEGSNLEPVEFVIENGEIFALVAD
jgi:nitrite reductase/ring-hydroxylating ferredoxin subunit